MLANLCCVECGGLCAPYTSSGEVLEVEDPEIAEHQLRFLDYPYKCEIRNPSDLALLRDEPMVSVTYVQSRNALSSEWNAAFRSLVANNVVIDLKLYIELDIESMEANEGPDFTILLRCPLKSFSVVNATYSRRIPQTIITALEAQRGLAALTLYDIHASDRLINLLNRECFPNLRYLNVRLDKDVDFWKLQQLTILKVSIASDADKIVDLRLLTRLVALDVWVGPRAVLKLGEDCSLLKWLHLHGEVEVSGDVSTVTHLLLASDGAKYDIVGRCPNLKQLSLYYAIFDSPIAIPASVDRLLIRGPVQKGVQLPAEQELDVLSLYDAGRTKLPPKLRARHLRLRYVHDDVPDFQNAFGETDLGSPESLCVQTPSRGLASVAFMESLLEKEEFRRRSQFLATDTPLIKPLPPMSELHEICLGRFADVEQIREIGRLRPFESLFIAGEDHRTFDNLEVLRLQGISKRLIVPEICEIPVDLGLPILKSTVPGDPTNLHRYNRFLWADYVKRSSGAQLDADYRLL